MHITRKAISRSGILRHLVVICLVLLTAGLVSQAGLAQQPGAQALGPQAPGGTMIGAFAGFTDRREADFTVGVRLDHPLQDGWSAGATVEHTPEGYFDSDSTLFMGLLSYRPEVNRRLKLTGGAGVEFNDAVDDGVMFRTGVGYDLFYEGGMVFTPEIGLNFGEGDESITLGASLNFNF